jgi:hypothetical protein
MLQARCDFVAGLTGHREPFRPLPRRGQVVSSSVAIQAAPPERSAISRPTGDVPGPSDRQDRSEAGARRRPLRQAKAPRSLGREAVAPAYFAGRAAESSSGSSHQSSVVVSPTTRGRSAGVYPGKGDEGIRPSTGESKRRRSDPASIVPALRSTSHDTRRSVRGLRRHNDPLRLRHG